MPPCSAVRACLLEKGLLSVLFDWPKEPVYTKIDLPSHRAGTPRLASPASHLGTRGYGIAFGHRALGAAISPGHDTGAANALGRVS